MKYWQQINISSHFVSPENVEAASTNIKMQLKHHISSLLYTFECSKCSYFVNDLSGLFHLLGQRCVSNFYALILTGEQSTWKAQPWIRQRDEIVNFIRRTEGSHTTNRILIVWILPSALKSKRQILRSPLERDRGWFRQRSKANFKLCVLRLFAKIRHIRVRTEALGFSEIETALNVLPVFQWLPLSPSTKK